LIFCPWFVRGIEVHCLTGAGQTGILGLHRRTVAEWLRLFSGQIHPGSSHSGAADYAEMTRPRRPGQDVQIFPWPGQEAMLTFRFYGNGCGRPGHAPVRVSGTVVTGRFSGLSGYPVGRWLSSGAPSISRRHPGCEYRTLIVRRPGGEQSNVDRCAYSRSIRRLRSPLRHVTTVVSVVTDNVACGWWGTN
jgi:hypothetical protein